MLDFLPSFIFGLTQDTLKNCSADHKFLKFFRRASIPGSVCLGFFCIIPLQIMPFLMPKAFDISLDKGFPTLAILKPYVRIVV